MKEQDPISIGLGRAHFPASQKNAIRDAKIEILAMRAETGENRVRFADETGRKLPADRVQKSRTGKPAHEDGDGRGSQRQDYENTDQAAHSLKNTRK